MNAREAAAEAVRRFRHHALGADRESDGYAIYFYSHVRLVGEAHTVVGGFATPAEASAAVPELVAGFVLIAYLSALAQDPPEDAVDVLADEYLSADDPDTDAKSDFRVAFVATIERLLESARDEAVATRG